MSVRVRQRWLILALVGAYLPSLAFLGHWTLRLDIPGTQYYVGLRAAAGAAQERHSHADANGPGSGDHSGHCHEGSASCGDVPVLATATVGLLKQSMLAQAEDEVLRPVAAAGWAPHATRNVMPELPPPRS